MLLLLDAGCLLFTVRLLGSDLWQESTFRDLLSVVYFLLREREWRQVAAYVLFIHACYVLQGLGVLFFTGRHCLALYFCYVGSS